MPFKPIGIPPGRFQSTPPVRVSKVADQIQKEAEESQGKWEEILGVTLKPFARSGTMTSQGRVVSWMLPECPPSAIKFWTAIAEIGLYFDDVTDTVDKESHKKILSDALNDVESLLGCEVRTNFLLQIQDAFSAQTAHVGNDMSFEEYQVFKVRHSGARFMANAIPHFTRHRVSQWEIDSVAYFLDKVLLSSSLLNDLYSFHKEFEDHNGTENLNTIGNGVALLMSSYGYNEDEARNVVQDKIRTLEKQGLEEFNPWKHSKSTKSQNLVGYVFTVLTMVGRLNYWMSHFERYFRTDFTTTAEDRAKLVKTSPSDLRRLQNYAVPLAVNGHTPSLGQSVSTFTCDISALKTVPLNYMDEDISEHTDVDITDIFRRADSEKLCMAPYSYIRTLPSKDSIVKFADAMRNWLKVPTASLDIIKSSTAMLFNSSLMLDGIQDDSTKRRGTPATHAMHGVAQTVNCVSYRNQNELEVLFSGQALELYWKFHKQCPTIGEYIVMIDHKTGGFFRLVMRLMAAEASSSILNNNNLDSFITLLGRYYQIRDDYQNLTSDEYAAKKGFCEDLSEGKFSIILIHTLQNSPTPDRIRGLIFGGATSSMFDEMRSYILSEMVAAGSLEYSRRLLTELYKSLLGILGDVETTMGPNKLLRNFLFLKL
ncbi:Geranylgeranyl pyrophosphate synthase [Penicillium fimorum]|uniref:Geranylgeranyl pyrophosphate synthase n=1 Tax=Penicillium fimorum TaxID=1882269 RepID=A0A9X0CCC1_9EURO|nr:Geranylgeranyl pyrophosphate synthase [Penicillium fimorum]